MAKQQKTKRAQIKDLSVTEQQMTQKEMEKVQGGKSFYESKSNVDYCKKCHQAPCKCTS